MTLFLKSDKTVTNYISDTSGLKDLDYFMNADFVNQKYKLNGNISAFADLFNYTRTGLAYEFDGSAIKNVPADTPIFKDYLGKNSGLWSAPIMGNLFGSGAQTTTKTTTIAGRVGQTASLIVWGAGSVTLSGDIEAVGSSLTASQGNPIQFRFKANASTPTSSVVTTTVNGSVIHYQAASDAPYFANQPTLATVNQASMFLKPSILSQLSSFTLLVRVKPYLISQPTVPIRFFEIDSDYNAVSVRNNLQGLMSARMSNGASSTDTAGEENTGEIIVAIKYSAGLMKVFSSGELKGEFAGNTASVLSNIQFLNTTKFTDGTSSKPFAGLLKNVTIYTKTMTDDELKKLSNSYRW